LEQSSRSNNKHGEISMSYDLAVSMPSRPDKLGQLWEREFVSLGFDVEIYPGFDPRTWRGGFLPFQVTKAPRELIGVDLDVPVISGFEIEFEIESAHLRTAMGRTTTEFALQCFGAAILAKLSGGEYIDDQNGIVCEPANAFVAAEKEVRYYLSTAGAKELAKHPFPGWAALE
jgi:hypothetical protein